MELNDLKIQSREGIFKFCAKCKKEWLTRDDFLHDPYVLIIGFMPNQHNYEKGIYLFNHVLPGDRCNTTLGLYVSGFIDLYEGDFYKDLKMGEKECLGHCTRIDNIENCHIKCRNSIPRNIIQKIIKILPSQSK